MKSFLYIDDENEDSIGTFIDSVNEDHVCEVILKRPSSFEDTASLIMENMQSKAFQGLILDWMLNDKPVLETGIPVKYKAAELAQFIRREIVERKTNIDFPIFIWSMEDRLMTSFYKDDTSHDLFDKIYLKSSYDSDVLTVDSSPELVRNEIIAFVDAYNFISNHFADKIPSAEVITKSLDSESLDIDKRIILNFEGTPYSQNVHSHVHFIYREVINKPGILIDEALLAARLGVNKDSSNDWQELIAQLEFCKYTGILSQVHKRWWMDGVNSWWHEQLDQSKPLSSLTASKRVDIISKKLGINEIKPAQPINGLVKSAFWFLCSGYKAPLDFEEGLMINEPNIYPWQDRSYISTTAVRDRVGYPKRVTIHPLEVGRLEEILS